MLEALEEGIVLLKANEIQFSNSKFDQIMQKTEKLLQQNSVLDKKIFQVFR